MPDKEILKPMVDKILHYSALPEQALKKKLWADHQALKKTSKVPVSVYYEGIPKPQWDLMLGKEFIRCATDTGRELEYFFRRVLWMAENVPDDHIVWPFAKIVAPTRTLQDWGVDMKSVKSHDEQGAYAFAAPFKEQIDLSRLREPVHVVDEEAWDRKKEQAAELTGGRLSLYPYFWNMGFSPFDTAALMRGLESLMFDPFDNPEQLHALLNFLFTAYEKHHLERERKGWLNFVVDPEKKYQPVLEYRIHCAHLPDEYRAGDPAPKLNYEWPYISAQTSSGFGPDMFREYVQDYNYRLARHFPRKTVYYHGCEPLDQKYPILKELPNLRRIHVSPWSSLPKAVEVFQGTAVMEVHSHPAKVLFGWKEEDMRGEIRKLVRESQGHPMDLNLSDIHSVNGNPANLGIWARTAQEEACKTT